MIKTTVYGHFGTMAETALKYTRDFSTFPFIIRAANLTIGKTYDKNKSSQWGVILVDFFRMQIVTVGWMVGRLLLL